KTSKSEATSVAVAKDATVTDIDFAMTQAKYGTITGTVTDENDSALQGWAFVDLFTYPTEGKITHENMWDYATEMIEMFYDQNSGQYTIKVAAGDYILGVGGDSNGTRYRSQFYNGAYDPKKATKITLAEDETKTIDFKLYPELRIEQDYFSQPGNENVAQLKISGTLSFEAADDSSGSRSIMKMPDNTGPPPSIPAPIYGLNADIVIEGITFKAGKMYAVITDPKDNT
ncbi:uncharacterized protein METZ01_LOCUS517471, partial [marine metagenome]